MPEPDFDKRGGLLPAIAQDVQTGQVLRGAYMNREAWRHTLATGKATYWSTSRNALWVKGETSGHVQHVRELLVDCDGDAVLLRVEQVGGVACHEGYASCFFRRVEGEDWRVGCWWWAATRRCGSPRTGAASASRPSWSATPAAGSRSGTSTCTSSSRGAPPRRRWPRAWWTRSSR